MMNISLNEIAKTIGCPSVANDIAIANIFRDTRETLPNSLFIAISGKNFDGHDFAAEAFEKGAVATVVSHLITGISPEKQLVVPDTKLAYLQIGGLIRSKSRAKVIAITGSAGKTTTKEQLKFILSPFAKVYTTDKNLNNDIGVAKTLCSMPPDAEIAIIEIGMSAAGKIASRVAHVRPDIAIITNIHPMHLEFFENFEGIAHAKAEVFSGLSNSGTAIINRDADFFPILEKEAKTRTKNVFLYSADDIISSNGPQITAKIHNMNVTFELAEDTGQNLMNALCSLNTAAALDLDIGKCAARIKDFDAPPGRGKIHTLALYEGAYKLMDHSYSAQPESLKLAILALGKASAGRKIAIIGKMAEIGEKSREMHEMIGRTIASTDIGIVVGVCPETRDILSQIPDRETHFFENADGLAAHLLSEIIRPGDTVLIKGSHYGSQLYKTAGELIAAGTAQ